MKASESTKKSETWKLGIRVTVRQKIEKTQQRKGFILNARGKRQTRRISKESVNKNKIMQKKKEKNAEKKQNPWN